MSFALKNHHHPILTKTPFGAWGGGSGITLAPAPRSTLRLEMALSVDLYYGSSDEFELEIGLDLGL